MISTDITRIAPGIVGRPARGGDAARGRRRGLRLAGRRVAVAGPSRHRQRRGPLGQRCRAVPERGIDAELRDRPGRVERLLRDGLRYPVQAVGGVHEAIPERDLGHQAGPVHEPHDGHAPPALRGQPAGPDPAAVDGLARRRTGCSRTWTTTRRRSVGTSGRPRSWPRTASPRTAREVPGRCTPWVSTTA